MLNRIPGIARHPSNTLRVGAPQKPGSFRPLPMGLSLLRQPGSFRPMRELLDRRSQAPGRFSRAATVFPAAKASFAVHKNGTDQGSISDATLTQVTWGTEVFDVGGFFSSSAWTPPAGRVMLTFQMRTTGITTTAGNLVLGAIYKNGAVLKYDINRAIVTTDAVTKLTIIDDANGTDVYTTYIYIDVSSGSGNVEGDITDSFFMGTLL
jgi:hypothetical protein